MTHWIISIRVCQRITINILVLYKLKIKNVIVKVNLNNIISNFHSIWDHAKKNNKQ